MEIHYDNTSMQYTVIFHGCKDVNFQLMFCLFLFLLQTELVGTSENRLSEGVLTSTDSLCFTAKKKKEFFYIKVG